MTALNLSVAASGDDAYGVSTTFSPTASTGNLGNVTGSIYGKSVDRFTGAGAIVGNTINSALFRVQFHTTDAGETINYTVQVEDADNPSMPTSVADMDGRTKTSGTAWNISTPGSISYLEVDISAEIQVLADRPSFAGNINVFLYNVSTSSGQRTLRYFYDSAGNPGAQLNIDYSAGVSNITGTAALAFGAGSSALLGTGALLGSSALVFAGTNILLGAGALLGSGALAFTTSGVLEGLSGAIAGSSSLTFTNSGTLLGEGTLLGTSTLTLGATGTTLGAGELAGSSSLTLAGSSTLLGSGAMLGASSLTFTVTSTLLGEGTLLGASTLSLAASSILLGEGSLSGSSALIFGDPVGATTEVQDLHFNGGTFGSVQLDIPSLGLVFANSIAGTLASWQALFSSYGTVSSIADGLRFNFILHAGEVIAPFNLTFDTTDGGGCYVTTFVDGGPGSSGTGTLTGSGSLAGSSALALVGSGSVLGNGALIGSSTIAFTSTGAMQAIGDLTGTATLTFTVEGTLTLIIITHFTEGILIGQPRAGGYLELLAVRAEGTLILLPQRSTGVIDTHPRADGVLLSSPRTIGKLELNN